MQDQSHVFKEAAVLGQLREQKPSASTEKPSLGNWVEEEAEEPKLASLHESLVSQETIVSEKATRPVLQQFFKETKSETVVLR